MWPSGANHRRDTNGSDTLHQRVSMQGSGWGGNLRLSDLDFKERIGVGCMNVEVFRATKRGVQDVAVKKIPKGAVDDISSISSEVSTMERVKGPNVLQFYGLLEDDSSFMIVMELCERGSLMEFLKQARQNPDVAARLTWPVRLEMAHRIASGMALIHAESVLHRDLKSPNVLLTRRMDVKVADFGFSRICDSIQQYASVTSPMNLRWLAPEIAQPDRDSATRWTAQADIYSFGVIMWELLTFQFPFAESDNLQLLLKMTRERRLTLPVPPLEEIPNGTFAQIDTYIELMQQCLRQTPEERPASFKVIMDQLGDMYDDCVGATSLVLPHGGYGGRLRQSPPQPPRPTAPAPSVQPSLASPFTTADVGPTPSTLPPPTTEPSPSFAVGGGSATSPFEAADSGTVALSMLPPQPQAALLEETGSQGPLEQIGSELPITPPSQVDEVAYYQHVARFLGWFQAIDEDHDALIDRHALHVVLHGMSSTDERAPYILSLVEHFQECDTNKDGFIDAFEFVTLAGRLLREREEAEGRAFDQQLYEQHLKESLAETKQLLKSVETSTALVYGNIFADYARWFRELDPNFTGIIDRAIIQRYLQTPSARREAGERDDKYEVFSSVARRFAEFDTNSDGVIDKHEYMHLCAKLVTESQRAHANGRFSEKHCRYMLYYYAMEEPEQSSVLFRKMQHNKLHVLGVAEDPGGYLRDALVEVGAEIKGEPVGDKTTFTVREFRYAFELLEQRRMQRVQQRYSAFGGRFMQPVAPTV